MSQAVESLITRLTAAGIQLRVEDGDRLRYRAPKGALTPEFAAEIKAHRSDLIAHLQATLGGAEESIVRLPDSPPLRLVSSAVAAVGLDATAAGFDGLQRALTLGIYGRTRSTVG